jgi:hypothetical protein
MYQHGPQGLEEYKDTLRKIRAQRKKTAYRQAEIKEAIIMWVVGGIIVLAGVAGFGGGAVLDRLSNRGNGNGTHSLDDWKFCRA